MTAGSARWERAGEQLDLSIGSVLLIPPAVPDTVTWEPRRTTRHGYLRLTRAEPGRGIERKGSVLVAAGTDDLVIALCERAGILADGGGPPARWRSPSPNWRSRRGSRLDSCPGRPNGTSGTGLGRAFSILRLARLAPLLARTNLTVDAASRGCGHQSSFHASRRFRAEYGLPPSANRAAAATHAGTLPDPVAGTRLFLLDRVVRDAEQQR